MGMMGGMGMQMGGAGLSSTTSAISSVISAYMQARSLRAMGKAQQQLATYNGQIAQAQAKVEIQSGNAAERAARTRAVQIRERNRYTREGAQAAMAKSGVQTSAGTPMVVAAENVMASKLESLDEIWRGKMEKREHTVRANYNYAQANISFWEGAMARQGARAQARQAILNGWGSAVGSMLQGSAQAMQIGGSYMAGSSGGGGGGQGAGTSDLSAPRGNMSENWPRGRYSNYA